MIAPFNPDEWARRDILDAVAHASGLAASLWSYVQMRGGPTNRARRWAASLMARLAGWILGVCIRLELDEWQ